MSDPLLKRIFNLIYPIGSIYKTIKSDNPSTMFGGTWILLKADTDLIHIASQDIYEYWSVSNATKHELIGAYGTDLIQGVFANRAQPNGYTKKIGCTAQIRTGGENYGKVFLNSKVMCEGRTWSGDTFRLAAPPGKLYTLSEIGTETTYGYSNPGINLYMQNTGNNVCEIRKVTVHGYFESNEKYYTWKRTG